MKKVKKGDYGYIRYEKKKRLLITVALFLIPLAAFLAAFLITGTKKNIITVIAMVGCLPACRALVNMIMMWMQKPMDKKVYKKIREHEGNLEVTYETRIALQDAKSPPEPTASGELSSHHRLPPVILFHIYFTVSHSPSPSN